jgi:hypothetical protein
MLPTGRKANGVIAMFLMTLHASCLAAPLPSVESCRLTMTDIEVLRIGLSSLIQPLVAQDPARVIVLTTSTLTIPLWQAPPVTLPPFSPPPPPPPFAGSGDHVVSRPEPSWFSFLYPPLLSPPERTAWERRNRVAREIPGLAIARLGNRDSADDVPAGWTVAAASAPSYPTHETAVLYAHYTCRGGCGEGRLIRLSRDGASWRITESQRLWIG